MLIETLFQGTGTLRSIFSPVGDLFTYIVPRLGAPLHGAENLSSDAHPSFNRVIDERKRRDILNTFKNLQEAVGLSRDVSFYTSMTPHFDHFGGRWSIGSPVVVIPFSQLQNDDQISDLGNKFLITRELVMIKQNDSILKTLSRLGMFAALLICFYFPGLGLLVSVPLFFAMCLLHVTAEKVLQKTVDRDALHAMVKAKIGTKKEIQSSIKRSLTTLRQENLILRTKSFWNRICIDEKGNERFKWSLPSFHKRLQAISSL